MIKNIIIVAIITILTKLTAFLTDIGYASKLGITAEADAFNVIFAIHAVLYPAISIGIWKIFLPQYIYLNKKQSSYTADNFANKLITINAVIIFILTLILICFSDQLVYIIVPGFDNYRHEMSSSLFKISSFQYIFISISSIYSVMLQAHGNFFASQVREIVTYIPSLVAIYFLYENYGITILPMALVIGAIFRLLVQLPYINWGYRFKIIFTVTDKNINRFFKNLPLALMVSSVDQINQLISKVMASTMKEGAIAVLSYGSKLNNVFGTIIGLVLSTVLFPKFSELIAKNQTDKIEMCFYKVIFLLIFGSIPICLYCCQNSMEIVTVIFYRDEFGLDAVIRTSNVFSCFVIGMLFSNIYLIFNNVFFAKEDQRTPLKISLVILIVNIIFCAILSKFFHEMGLAIANSISLLVGSVCVMYFSFRYIKKYILKLLLFSMKCFLIAALCGFISFVVNAFVNTEFYRVAISAILYASVYLALMILCDHQVRSYANEVISKIHRR